MRLRLLVGSLLIPAAFTPSAHAQSAILIEQVTLIDGTGRAPKPDFCILVAGDKIDKVAGCPMTPPAGAKRVAGRGKYLIPGMMDIHVHLRGGGSPLQAQNRPPDERTGIRAVQSYLYSGFTTILDVGNNPDHIFKLLARIAHANGALLFLDGYQDCGTRPMDVKALDVDFFVTGTLKYLLGPPGLAFLYVRRELTESLTPTITSWMAQREVFAFRTKCLDPSPDARRFEGGSPPIPNIYLARPALNLLTEVGMENVAKQIERLARAFLDGVHTLRIDSKTPAASVGPLVVLRSKDAQAMLNKLTARNIIASTRRDGVRFAFHVYNTIEDVNAALSALDENLDLMAPS